MVHWQMIGIPIKAIRVVNQIWKYILKKCYFWIFIGNFKEKDYNCPKTGDRLEDWTEHKNNKDWPEN